MPIHDWTRVTAGTFHDFHLAWIAELRRALNAGILPDGYYALAEQLANRTIPDVLTLQDAGDGGEPDGFERPPRVSLSDTITEATLLAARGRRMVIRHATGDRVVAFVEIVSPGNKDKAAAVDAFVDKAADAIVSGYHMLVLDLLPPGPFDPTGVHGAVWGRLGGDYRGPGDVLLRRADRGRHPADRHAAVPRPRPLRQRPARANLPRGLRGCARPVETRDRGAERPAIGRPIAAAHFSDAPRRAADDDRPYGQCRHPLPQHVPRARRWSAVMTANPVAGSR